MALAALVGFIVGFVLSGGQDLPLLARLAIAAGTAVDVLTLAGALLSGADD